MRSPSPRPTSLATSSAQQPETSTPSRQYEADKSLEKSKDEPPAKKALAKKRRVCKISSSSGSSSSSSSSSSDSSSSDSSSSEDEAIDEDKVLDRSEEEQHRVLKKKQAARKRLKRRMKEKARRSVLKWAKELSASLHETLETEKEAEETEAEQLKEEAVEAETPEADLMETGQGERSEKRNEDERSRERTVRYQTVKDRLGNPAPPVAEETSAAAVDGAQRLCRLAGYTIPRIVSPIRKCFFESFETLPPTLESCIIRVSETTQERLLSGILVDTGMVLSGKQAVSYTKPHFRFQKERTHRREDYRKFNSD